MRIESTGDSVAVGPASPDRRDNQAAPSTRRGADYADLSTLTRTAAVRTPARVEAIKARVSAGTYQVNAGEVSRRVVDYYLIPVT